MITTMSYDSIIIAQKKILVVEDDLALQEAIVLKLTSDKYSVKAFSNGKEALESLKDDVPDLVWLDMLLPGIDGLEVLKSIREKMHLRDLLVVIVSVSAGPEKIKRAFELGVCDYIVKSDYNLKEIIRKVEAHLRAKESRDTKK